MVTALSAVSRVVEAVRKGAYDYLTKPFDVEEVRCTVERALENNTLERRVRILESEMSREFPIEGIVGRAPAFLDALEDARKAAATDATVLIQGESGTGKELIARLIHKLSPRGDEPFVPVHCAALPESLMESELFGYEKGAFTNADQRKLGRFDLAGSGTLFFDELGEMTQATQVKLLRVLQEKEFMRVGGTHVIHTDARIVAATSRNLKEEVQAERFRDDLYYRISVVPIVLPPLRERNEDIERLARHFLQYFRERIDVSTGDFHEDTLMLLREYPWPGNVRELRNIVERMLVLYGHEPIIKPDFLPAEFRDQEISFAPSVTTDVPLADAVSAFERELVVSALKESKGVQTHAAERLGTTRRILRYRMDKLGIDSDRFQE
jgi:DNA-binding NtrC family response regulator